MIGNIVPDFPLINKSFNLSYSGSRPLMWKVIRQIARHRNLTEPAPDGDAGDATLRIQRELLAILGQALAIRQVDAGSCNGCELEIHA